ncbi:hypothetical protein CsatB_000578 [Cannabis sativa]
MTKDIIMSVVEEKDVGRLAQVSEKYSEIDHADWCTFVASRLTPEFQFIWFESCLLAWVV